MDTYHYKHVLYDSLEGIFHIPRGGGSRVSLARVLGNWCVGSLGTTVAWSLLGRSFGVGHTCVTRSESITPLLIRALGSS